MQRLRARPTTTVVNGTEWKAYGVHAAAHALHARGGHAAVLLFHVRAAGGLDERVIDNPLVAAGVARPGVRQRRRDRKAIAKGGDHEEGEEAAARQRALETER